MKNAKKNWGVIKREKHKWGMSWVKLNSVWFLFFIPKHIRKQVHRLPAFSPVWSEDNISKLDGRRLTYFLNSKLLLTRPTNDIKLILWTC